MTFIEKVVTLRCFDLSPFFFNLKWVDMISVWQNKGVFNLSIFRFLLIVIGVINGVCVCVCMSERRHNRRKQLNIEKHYGGDRGRKRRIRVIERERERE